MIDNFFTMFPGQGSQRAGMAGHLLREHPAPPDASWRARRTPPACR
ncbi:hypothetical protein ACFQ51_50045 [Streptomyces kaempferi]